LRDVVLLVLDVVDGYTFNCFDEEVVFVMDVVGELVNWDEASYNYNLLVMMNPGGRRTYWRDASRSPRTVYKIFSYTTASALSCRVSQPLRFQC